jgi:hypothetical protein
MESIIFARLIHVVGFALGMGGAIGLDLLAMQLLSRPISQDDLRVTARLGWSVMAGFYLLLGSGATFLLIYALSDPAKLTNPKLLAKIVVVAVLAANALLVHRFVLPRIGRQIGRRLFEGCTPRERDAMLVVGAVSAVSWLTAMVLGAVRELNSTATFDVVLASYVAALSLAALVMLVGARLVPGGLLQVSEKASDVTSADEATLEGAR